jgi:hypothetical protein
MLENMLENMKWQHPTINSIHAILYSVLMVHRFDSARAQFGFKNLFCIVYKR